MSIVERSNCLALSSAQCPPRSFPQSLCHLNRFHSYEYEIINDMHCPSVCPAQVFIHLMICSIKSVASLTRMLRCCLCLRSS